MPRSDGVMLGVEVAAAAPAALRSCRLVSALFRPSCTARVSYAKKYLPRPLTAACHRSSRLPGLRLPGIGQLQAPVVQAQALSAPLRTLSKSPVASGDS